jgi:hypothetical protein
MKNRRAMRKFVGGLALAGVLAGGPSVMALPVGTPFADQNFLNGAGYGLDENFVGSPGDYIMPDGSTSGPVGTSGMTETIFTAARPGAPLGGVNIPQPALLGAGSGDSRLGVLNPLAGAPVWGARSGAVVRWDVLADIGGTVAPLTPGVVTGVLYNMTPGPFTSLTIGAGGPVFPVDDGMSPGSAVDGFPDTLPFALDLAGRRFASFSLGFLGDDPDTAAIFGGAVPTAMLPVVELWDGGAGLVLSDGTLAEGDFNHNGGPFAGGAGAAHDGTLLLTGVLGDAFTNQTILETAAGSGEFFLDIEFFGNVRYTGGGLVSDGTVAVGSVGTVGANWNDIPFTEAGPGGMFPNGTFDRNGLASFDFRPGGSFSADQSFVGTAVPEPATVGLGMLVLGSLASYSLGRSRQRAV